MPILLLLLLLVLLVVVLAALVLPLAAGVILIRRKYTKSGAAILCVYLFFVGAFLLHAQLNKRRSPGRIVRYIMGAGIAKQETEDEAEDLKQSPGLPKVQSWAIETMQRFSSGTLSTNDAGDNWPFRRVQLAPSEVPEFVLAEWKVKEALEVSIELSDSGNPECVVIAGYLKGMVIGDQSYQLSLSEMHSQTRVVPGVYVYYFAK